jgi:hypothetical protein
MPCPYKCCTPDVDGLDSSSSSPSSVKKKNLTWEARLPYLSSHMAGACRWLPKTRKVSGAPVFSSSQTCCAMAAAG